MAPRLIAIVILVIIYISTKLFHAEWVLWVILSAVIAVGIIDYYWLGGKLIGGSYKDGKK